MKSQSNRRFLILSKILLKIKGLLQNNNAEKFGNVSRNTLTDALVNVRQHEICLKTLLHDIINCAKINYLNNTNNIKVRNSINYPKLYGSNIIYLFKKQLKKLIKHISKTFI